MTQGPLLSGLMVFYALSLPALVLTGIVVLAGIAFGFPAGWAIAVAVFCFAWARNGWSATSGVMAVRPDSILHNGQGAFALLHVLALLLAIFFAGSSLPHRLSQWWALLLPLVPLPMLLTQVALEAALNIVNPEGKRA